MNESSTSKKMENFRNTKFAQQKLRSWRPIMIHNVAIIYLIISIICFTVFIIVFEICYKNVKEVTKRYDNECLSNFSNCTLTVSLPQIHDTTILFYYELTNFYQSHRRFLTSKNIRQLRGEYVKFSDLSDCKPYRGINDDEDKILLPSGLAGISVFNDTFRWENSSLGFSEDNIIDSNQKKNFKNISSQYKNGIRWLEETQFGNPSNPHFIQWMNLGHLSTIRKLYMKCSNCNIDKGNYSIIVKSNYPLSGFKGQKRIVILTETQIGSKNHFYAIVSYSILGVLLFCIIIIILTLLYHPRKLGDLSIIEEGF